MDMEEGKVTAVTCISATAEQDSHCKSGSSCSKLTMSLVNVSLKFQTLISNNYHYFF